MPAIQGRIRCVRHTKRNLNRPSRAKGAVRARALLLPVSSLEGKRIRLRLDPLRGREARYVEGVVECWGTRAAHNGKQRMREPHLVIPAPDGRCPYYVHDKRAFEVLG